MCALTSLMFFGGWLSPIPGLPDGVFWMIAKMAFFFFLFAMVKAITPRYRYDQLMRIGWKVFLPLSLGLGRDRGVSREIRSARRVLGPLGDWRLSHDADRLRTARRGISCCRTFSRGSSWASSTSSRPRRR